MEMLAHAQTVCTRLSFPPMKESLGSRLTKVHYIDSDDARSIASVYVSLSVVGIHSVGLNV